MSDSMAFLAGGAFAGIAALLLLKGGGSFGQSNPLPAVQQSPVPVQPSATIPPGMVSSSPYMSAYNFEQQRLIDERLKDQIEMQRTEIEYLKNQLRNQQMVIDTLSPQNKANVYAAPPQLRQGQALATVEQPANPMFAGILWALGGAVVTVSGGAIVIGSLTLLSQQQRPRRTVQVIHPINSYPPTLQTKRRPEFLPPRLETRRVEEIEYDEG